jgi:hypothetical protein
MDAAREVAQLVETPLSSSRTRMSLSARSSTSPRSAARITCEQHRGGDEPLFGAVVKIALEVPPRLVAGFDDARARRLRFGRQLAQLVERNVAGDASACARQVCETCECSWAGRDFAGDVRHGSTKRVASAVGESAMAIALVHTYLRDFNDTGRTAQCEARRSRREVVRRS